MRVFDRWTCNQTCFNAARALKPLNNGEAKPVSCVEVPVGSKVPDCDFCTPLDFTAAGNTVHDTYLAHRRALYSVFTQVNNNEKHLN